MRKALFILSEYGYWGEELVGPYEVLDRAGYEIIFATPTGKRPHALSPSKIANLVAPPLDKIVVSPEMAEKVKTIDESDLLDNPLNIEELVNVRPYISAKHYLRKLEAYNDSVDMASEQLKDYDVLVLVGGSGPMIDMANNERIHDIIKAFVAAGKPVAAECYGVTCLAFARDYWIRKSMIWGKHVTGHPIEFDYKDPSPFYGTDFTIPMSLYPLEYILRDAVGPDGEYHGNVGKKLSVIVDYPFITSRSIDDSYKCGEMILEVVENGVTRYGW